MKRGISYGRVSTGRQAEEGTSLEAQHETNRKKAQELGVEIKPEHFLDDDVSGELYLARPKVQEVLFLVESKQVEYVFFYKLDRSGRDTASLLDIRKRLQRAGAIVVYTSGQEFKNDPTGNLTYTMMAGFAEFEKDLIKERTMRGSRARVTQEGRQVSMISPYGYHIVNSADIIRGEYPADMRGKYVIKHPECEVAVWVFRAYVEGCSLEKIQRILNAQGTPAPRGGLWTRGGISTILKNPAYKGTPAYGKTKSIRDEKRHAEGIAVTYHVSTDESEWDYLECEPLVTVEMWNTVRERRSQNQSFDRGNPLTRYLLSGFIICPECGGKMRGACRKPGAPRYYICDTHSRSRKVDCSFSTNLPANQIDESVKKALIQYITEPHHFQQAMQAYEKNLTVPVVSQLGKLTHEQFAQKKTALDHKEKLLISGKIEDMSSGGDGRLYADLIVDVKKERQDLVSLWKDQTPATPLSVARIKNNNEQFEYVIEHSRAIIMDSTDTIQSKLVLRSMIKAIIPDTLGNLRVRFVTDAWANVTLQSGIVSITLPNPDENTA